MWDVLHAFGAGISFSFGVFVGAMMLHLANKQSRKEFVDDWREQQKAVEDRLREQCEAVVRIAVALEGVRALKDSVRELSDGIGESN